MTVLINSAVFGISTLGYKLLHVDVFGSNAIDIGTLKLGKVRLLCISLNIS